MRKSILTKSSLSVVPFTAGGPTDTVARLMAQPMSTALKGQIIVENVGGAGGTIGANRVAKAAPDGYTLLLIISATPPRRPSIANCPTTRSTTSSPIGLINEVPMTLIARQRLSTQGS